MGAEQAGTGHVSGAQQVPQLGGDLGGGTRQLG